MMIFAQMKLNIFDLFGDFAIIFDWKFKFGFI